MAKKKISNLFLYPGTFNNNLYIPAFYDGVTYRISASKFLQAITKEAVGLTHVDNTSDVDKPLSAATTAALLLKAPLIHRHNYTDIDNLHSSIESGISSSNVISNIQTILASKASSAHSHSVIEIPGLQTALNSKANNSHNHSKNEVGLGNVDNTSDIDKPLSNTQKIYVDQAISQVASKTGPHTHSVIDVTGLQTLLDSKTSEARVNQIIQNVIGTAPDALNTLQEIAASIGNNSDFVGTITNQLNQKSDKTHTHVVTKSDIGLTNVNNTSDIDKPVSNATLTALNNKSNIGHNHNQEDITGLSSALSSMSTRIDQIVISGNGINSINDVPGLTVILDSKADSTLLLNHYTKSEIDVGISNITAGLVSKANINHTHIISNINGLQSVLDNKADKVHNHILTKSDVGLANVDNTSDVNKPISAAVQTALSTKIDSSIISAVNGIAKLDSNGKLVNNQLPDHSHPVTKQVLEYDNPSLFPVNGSIETLYVSRSDNVIYRWNGISYINISSVNTNTGVTSINGENGDVVLTKLKINLGNVDNTSDINKPISIDTQNALNNKSNINHSHTKIDVGLNNVDNTADLDKPISTAVSSALAGKSDIVHTHTKTDLGLGNVDNTSDEDKPLSLAALVSLSNKSNINHIHNKSEIGLTNIDNTSDLDKPVSTATQTALNNKTDLNHTHNKDDVGLDQVDNTRDLDKPISISVETALNAKSDLTHSHTKTDIGLSDVDNTSDINKPISTATQTALNLKIDVSKIGIADGIAPLGSNGKVPAANLPGYIDDVQEYADSASFPVTGEPNIVYLAMDTGYQFRWSGTMYANISVSTGGVQTVSGRNGDIVLNKNDVGLGNVDNISDINKPLSTIQKDYIDTATLGLQSAINTHVHLINNISGLQTALDSKSSISHIHNVVNINGLAAALNEKSDNTHTHTKADLGLGNVDNTSDLDKPISNQIQSALSNKADVMHLHSRNDIGLGNVDNTSDINKPISNLQQTALDNKANILHTHAVADTTGLQTALDNLSSRIDSVIAGGVDSIDDVPGLTVALDAKVDDATLAQYYTKLEIDSGTAALGTAIGSKANVSHTHTVANITGLETILTGKSDTTHTHNVASITGLQSALDNKASISHTHIVTKTDIGLNNVDNTSDINKPISAATQTALDTKTNTVITDNILTQITDLNNNKAPIAHTHTVGQVTGLRTELDTITTRIDNLTAGTVDSISDVPGLVAALDGKVDDVQLNSFYTKTETDSGITAMNVVISGKAPISHTHVVSNITGLQTLIDNKSDITHIHSKNSIGLGNVDNTSDINKPISTAVQTALNSKLNSSLLGLVDGVATLDNTGKLTNNQLPVIVLKFDNLSLFPVNGDENKVYSAKDTGFLYTWNTDQYKQVLGTGGGGGGGSVDSVNSKTGVVVLTKSDIGLSNVDNTSDANKPVSTAVQIELSGLNSAISNKADQSTLNAVILQVSNKAEGYHGHPVNQITGLETALSNKSDISHTHTVTKTDVGLSDVDNTSDLDKPISNPTKTYVDTAIAGVSGGGGGSFDNVINNTSVRYLALTSLGYRVQCSSSANIYTNLTWNRTGTSLVITHIAHGRSIGDRVIIKNTNEQFNNQLITNITSDTYTVACQDIGDVSGNKGMYTCGFNFQHNSELAGALTGGVLIAPANCDIQLHSLRVNTKANSRTGATYDLTIPTGVFNPAGLNTTTDDTYVPLSQVRGSQDTMPIVGNSLAINQTGSYSIFRFAALGSVAQGQVMMLQF